MDLWVGQRIKRYTGPGGVPTFCDVFLSAPAGQRSSSLAGLTFLVWVVNTQGEKSVPVIDQLQAVALATRFLLTHAPYADFREVWARLDEGKWWVSFGKVFPPNVVESPGGWCVTVDVKTGMAEWFLTL